MRSVCIVVPVYNSRDSLQKIVELTTAALDSNLSRWHLIFVDDRSPSPGTWPRLRELAATHRNVTAVRLLKNRGRASAVLCGIRHARSIDPDAAIVVMDDDLQHDPADILRLFERLRDDPEADVAIAQFPQKQHDALARTGSMVKSMIDRYYYGLPGDIRLTSFIAMTPQVAAALDGTQATFPLFGSQLIKVAGTFRAVPCLHDRRHDGVPAYSLAKRIRLFSRIIFSDTILILRLFAYAGMSIAVLSIFVGGFFVIDRLVTSSTLVGWTSLFVMISLLGGLNMFICGLIGINIIRTKENVELLPAWTERETVGALGEQLPQPVSRPVARHDDGERRSDR